MKKIIACLLLCSFQLPADEVLTQEERIVALTILGEARGEKKNWHVCCGMYYPTTRLRT